MLNNSGFDRFSFLNYQDISVFTQKYSGSIFVIKYGGSAMKNYNLRLKVIEDLAFLYSLGIKIILVHGGGPFINDWLVKLNIKPKFENGIRITDYNTMEIVEMVLSGKVNKQLVSLLSKKNILSVGLSGKDCNLITASSLFNSCNNFVGKVEKINNKLLNLLLDNNYIPVIASIASDFENCTYNINADTVAGAISSSMNANKLILLTDTPGVMLDMSDSSTLIKTLTLNYVNELKKKKVITGGMLPKIDCCIDGLLSSSSMSSAHIIDGRIEHSLLYELLTLDRLGSMITLS
uniref:Acetylglutamate kinase n=1 Tax=Acrosorium ciliolatum TaxID=1550622 RepID=A0A1Z1M2N1_9FLOR|nr:acetylglutamate kinase [Acrosorium ciliolatum]ARW60073.1 acetylglutamate kinase [Acrosorium ciliolatum]